MCFSLYQIKLLYNVAIKIYRLHYITYFEFLLTFLDHNELIFWDAWIILSNSGVLTILECLIYFSRRLRCSTCFTPRTMIYTNLLLCTFLCTQNVFWEAIMDLFIPQSFVLLDRFFTMQDKEIVLSAKNSSGLIAKFVP